MTAWLDPLRRALGDSDRTLTVFVRDDDAGWADTKLYALLDTFEDAEAPIDVAAIPAHVTANCAAELIRRRSQTPHLRVHQHGFAHVNHEVEGRKCEFGPSRNALRQQADIRQGKERLAAFLGPTDPVFTPPWNRCTQATVDALQREGFRILSREARATELNMGDLTHTPVTLDWRRKRDGVRATPAETIESMASQVQAGTGLIGLMLHHETLDEDDLALLRELMLLIRGHSGVRMSNIVELGEKAHAIG